MSYDLAVFDVGSAPREREGFDRWFKQQTAWSDGAGCHDPGVLTDALRAWFEEIILEYPPMNGPLAVDRPDDARVTDYSLGTAVIYAAFAWSVMEKARGDVVRLAAKHRVGFLDVSSIGSRAWIPDGHGGWVETAERVRKGGGIQAIVGKIVRWRGGTRKG